MASALQIDATLRIDAIPGRRRRAIATAAASILALAFALAGVATPGFAAGAEDPLKTIAIEMAFKAAPKHKFGESRMPLSVIAAAVKESLGDVARREALAKRLGEIAASSDATFEARQFACSQLYFIGNAAQVAALAPMLDDPKLGDAARIALEAIPDPEAAAALRAAVARTSGLARVGAIDSLGAKRDADSVEVLGALLGDADPATASAAARALARIGVAQAATFLAQAEIAARKAGDEAKRRELATALLLCADNMLASGDAVSAGNVYEEFARTERPRAERFAARRGLLRTKGKAAAPGILALANCPDPDMELFEAYLEPETRARARAEIAASAADATRLVREAPADPELTRMFAGGAVRLGKAGEGLLQALVDRGDPAAVPVLLLADREGPTGVATIAAIGALGGAEAVPALVDAAIGEDEPIAAAARDALAALPGPGVDEALAIVLKKQWPAEQTVAAKALGARRATSAREAIEFAIDDASPLVRAAAYEALGAIAGGEAAVPLLGALVKERESHALAALERAVAAAADASDDKPALESRIADAFRGADAVSKPSLLRVLGRIGGAPGSPRLILAALDDSDPAIALAAIEGLAAAPDGSSAPILADRFVREKDEARRAAALAGFVRLLALPSERSPEDSLKLWRDASAAAKGDESATLLAALPAIPTLAALEEATSRLATVELQQAAAASAVAIAEAIRGRAPAEAKAALARARDVSTDEAVRERAARAIASIESFEDYVVAWEVAGPFTAPGKESAVDLFDVEFAPETADAGGVEWKPLPVGDDPERPWLLDLEKHLGGKGRVAYLRTRLRVPNALEARLELGSDDGAKVWLNGELVHANNATRGLTLGEDRADAKLKAGENVLLVKVTQGGGHWGAALRVRAADGSKIEGLRAAP